MLERERQTNREIYDNIKSGQEELKGYKARYQEQA